MDAFGSDWCMMIANAGKLCIDVQSLGAPEPVDARELSLPADDVYLRNMLGCFNMFHMYYHTSLMLSNIMQAALGLWAILKVIHL